MRTLAHSPTARWSLGAAAALLLLSTACARRAPPDFQNTFDTKDALTRAVLDALWQRNPERLSNLAVSEAEFRTYVWPELPAVRAGVGGSADYWWEDLRTRSLGSMSHVLERYGGKRLALESVSFEGESADYGTFTVHRESSVSVRDETGTMIDVRLFGSLIDTPNGWKVYSYVID